MKNVRQILDVKGYKVHSVAPETSVYDALNMMANHDVGALAVLEGNEIAGLLSERDYARKVILKGRSSKETPVSEIMTRRVHCVSPGQTVDAVMSIMTEQRLRHLLVLEDGRLVGVVSIGDVVKAVIEDQQFTIEQLQTYITGGYNGSLGDAL
jgi:CBS domain-containing protein